MTAEVCQVAGRWTFLTEQGARDFKRRAGAHGPVRRCDACSGWHWERREAPRPVVA